MISAVSDRYCQPARHCRRRGSAISMKTSSRMCVCRRSVVVPIYLPALWAATRCYRFTMVKFSVGCWVWLLKSSMTPANRCMATRVSWCAPMCFPVCPSVFGTTKMAVNTIKPILIVLTMSGVMETLLRSLKPVAWWYTVVQTPFSTPVVCALVPLKSIVRSSCWTRSSNHWW